MKTMDIVGGFSDEGPPVPIPNTVVKLIRAEDTRLEAARENRALPTYIHFFHNKPIQIFLLSSVGRAPDC